MTRADWQTAAVLVALWAVAVVLTAVASSVADYYGSARQALAFHHISVGLLLAPAVAAVCGGLIFGVVARPRASKLRGGTGFSWGAPLRSGSVSRVSPRSIPHERLAFDAFGHRRVFRGRKGEQ